MTGPATCPRGWVLPTMLCITLVLASSLKTRMHSSRIRTVRFSGHLPCAQAILPRMSPPATHAPTLCHTYLSYMLPWPCITPIDHAYPSSPCMIPFTTHVPLCHACPPFAMHPLSPCKPPPLWTDKHLWKHTPTQTLFAGGNYIWRQN